MLVVKRKIGESIVIGDNIEVKIVKIEDGSVKVAIEAPRDITVLRKELVEEVINENKEALQNVEVDLKKIFISNKE